MRILAFETSCDDSSIAYVDFNRDIRWVCSASQIDFHVPWGGVVPEIAARKHFEVLPELYREFENRHSLDEVDLVGVTYGPGLAGSLLVGLSFAKSLAYSSGKKLSAVNHLYGHLAVSFMDIEFPALALLISGGHTNLYYLTDPYQIEDIGRTLDDAAGEAFDKVSKEIGAGYPGGPVIEKLASAGNCTIDFPVGLPQKENLNFSFSGLKTSVINYFRNHPEVSLEDLACSFQQAVLRAFEKKVSAALGKHRGVRTFLLGGGVAANRTICAGMNELCVSKGVRFVAPPAGYCTDNAVMIAYGAYYKSRRGILNDPLLVDIKPDESELI